MTDEKNSVQVKLMGRSFKVKCTPDTLSELQESVAYLNAKMHEIADTAKLSGIDTIAAVAALNITHELNIERRQRQESIEKMHGQITSLQNKIESALAGEN